MSAVTYDVRALLDAPDTIAAAEAITASRGGLAPEPIEQIALESSDAERLAGETLTLGWQRAPHPRVLLAVPVAWDEVCAASRSWTFHLHAWEPLADPLTAYGTSRERRYLHWCLRLARDWVCQHPTGGGESPFAWYDMAVGMRAYRLAYLIDHAVRESMLPHDDVVRMVASLRVHLSVLSDDDHFREHSNHGVYQAAGQLAAALRLPEIPEASAAVTQGRDRLHRLVDRHFDEEGIHREHSPGYHLMVLRSLLRLRTARIIQDAEVLATLARAEDAMSWLVAPVGTVPTVGDSDRRTSSIVRDTNVASTALAFALSHGQHGIPPTSTSRVFQAGGYVVARDGWFRGERFATSSYLLQSCGFHSRVHKHADDLSFVWYAHGTDLLGDPGRYGYLGRVKPDSPLGEQGFYYSAPQRIYVESTRAHNCLEIDGRSYPRRHVRPYGSAIISGGVDSGTGLVTSFAAVTHFRSVKHTRLLIHQPAQWLLVVDHAIGRIDDRHQYVQRFHFGPDLDLADSTGGVFRLSIPGTTRQLLACQLGDADCIPPVRGQTDPDLLGFTSRRPGEFVPNWTVGWGRADVRAATFLTLFAIGAPTDVLNASGRLNATARVGRATFVLGGERHTVNWHRSVDGLTLDYATSRS